MAYRKRTRKGYRKSYGKKSYRGKRRYGRKKSGRIAFNPRGGT